MIGFVDDERVDPVEPQFVLLDEVEHAARAADHDLGATAQLIDLPRHGHAAEEGDHLQRAVPREHGDLRRDLGCQLTGGGEDQRAGIAATSVPGRREQPVQQGQGEGRGLAGAGHGQAEDVAALEAGGNGVGLDGAGAGEARVANAAQQGVVEAKAVEAAGGRRLI